MNFLFCKIWLDLAALIQAKLQLALTGVLAEEGREKKPTIKHLNPKLQNLTFPWNSHEISGQFCSDYKNNFNTHLPFCFRSQPGASNVELSVNKKYVRKIEEIKKTEKDLEHWTNMAKPHFVPGSVRNNKSMLCHPSVRDVYLKYVCYVNMKSMCNTTCTKISPFWLCKDPVWSEIRTTSKGCRWCTSAYAQQRVRAAAAHMDFVICGGSVWESRSFPLRQ